MSDHTTKCWGWYGIDYQPTQSMESLTPITFHGLPDPIEKISIGSLYACAWTVKDELLCWGGNYYGELGDGTTQDSSTPVYVAGFGLEISRFEVNQAIGKDLLADQLYIQLVARKSTTVRVSLNKPVRIDNSRQHLEIVRDGSLVTTLYPQPSRTATSLITFFCRSMAECGGWLSGHYTFHLVVNGVTITKSTEFQSKRSLRILAVPIRVKADGVVLHPREGWQTAETFMLKLTPCLITGLYGYRTLSWMLRI